MLIDYKVVDSLPLGKLFYYFTYCLTFNHLNDGHIRDYYMILTLNHDGDTLDFYSITCPDCSSSLLVETFDLGEDDFGIGYCPNCGTRLEVEQCTAYRVVNSEPSDLSDHYELE